LPQTPVAFTTVLVLITPVGNETKYVVEFDEAENECVMISVLKNG
jgi:hypothetical protein